MRGIRCVLALAVLGHRLAAAQLQSDTTVTLQGFVQENLEGARWALLSPLPVTALGIRTFVIELAKGDRWSGLAAHYVSASGALLRNQTGQLSLVADSMREVEPPGTAHATLIRGMTQHPRISLAVVPNAFAWNDSAGRSTGVNPVILYGIRNDRSTTIYLVLQSNDLLCVHVQGTTSMWDTTTVELNPTYHRFLIQHGGEFRQALQLPPEAAPRPGAYIATVRLCEIEGYEITTRFEVQ